MLYVGSVNVTNAARIDNYRNILLNGTYTIRYENITPATRVTNRDRGELYGKSSLSIERNDYLQHKQTSGIITADGGNRYEEVGDGKFNMCRLSKDGEDFFFTKYKKGDGWEYFGTRKNRVAANEKNYFAELVEGKSYGDADMTDLINAMLPDEQKSARLSRYKQISAGKLKDGVFYEDYKTATNGANAVIRYYFTADKLTRIASASYIRRGDGKIDGQKCIIKILEFSAVPTKDLLKLPDGVKDETKRKANKIDEPNKQQGKGNRNNEE